MEAFKNFPNVSKNNKSITWLLAFLRKWNIFFAHKIQEIERQFLPNSFSIFLHSLKYQVSE